MRRGIDHSQGIVAAQGHVGDLAIGREGDASGDRVALQIDVAGPSWHADVGELGHQDAVAAVARGLAGPQFAVAGPEGDARVGGGPRGDFRDARARGAVEQEEAARIEDGEDAFGGIESHVHGAAGDHGLFTPGPEHLVGGDQVISTSLVAEGGGGLECGEDRGFLGNQGCPSQSDGTKDGGTHGLFQDNPCR